MEGGHLVRGGIVFEGSAGSTAISIATVAPAFGCKCHVVIPDDAAIEKVFFFCSIVVDILSGGNARLVVYSKFQTVGLVK